MKRIIGLLMACCFALSMFAEDQVPEAVEVSGEYLYLVPTDMSLDKAKEIALVGAQKEAMGKKFGFLIISDDKLVVVERDEEAETYFNSYENSEVKGLWLETIGKPKYEVQMDEVTGGLKIHVTVKGMARERVTAHIELDTKLLRNETDKTESLTFTSEENFFLGFKTPVNGYLTIYLVDEKGDAFCLLPYGRQEAGSMAVKANQEYIFFSEKSSPKDLLPYVDEYFFFTDKSLEHNRLCILFSPQLFVKASDRSGSYHQSVNSNLPREVKAQDFHEWLAKQKQMDSYLQVIEKEVEIKRE